MFKYKQILVLSCDYIEIVRDTAAGSAGLDGLDSGQERSSVGGKVGEELGPWAIES